jgi:hypothetical protein
VNTFKDGEEPFTAQFADDGKNWATMMEGAMHRTGK